MTTKPSEAIFFIHQNWLKPIATYKAWEKEDLVVSGKPNAAGWLLPEGNNIHRGYPEVAILIPDSMGGPVVALCAFVNMYDLKVKGLELRIIEAENHGTKTKNLMAYFKEDTQLRDILITGGDALMSQNKTLKHILEAVLQMAKTNRKLICKDQMVKKYAELTCIRLGSRLLAYLPMRVDKELIDILKDVKQKEV